MTSGRNYRGFNIRYSTQGSVIVRENGVVVATCASENCALVWIDQEVHEDYGCMRARAEGRERT